MSAFTRLLRPAERLTAALCDPLRRERAAVIALIGYAAIWTLYGVIAKGSQGVHFDMAELADQSRHLAFGYAKNPPAAMWLVAGWFAIFPRADWAFYLLAMSSVAFTFWLTWRIAGRYLDGEKRVAALALLTFIPFMNFHALKFNNNVAMLPFWALTTLFFIRSFESRKILDAALAGLFAACAMQVKYWSVFLLVGLALAVLADRRRGAYLRSAAPWVTIVIGAAALAPHVLWLVGNNFSSFGYALIVHGGKTFVGALKGIGNYLGAALGYVSVALIVALAATRPSRAAIADMLAPKDDARRFIAVVFWVSLLLPLAAALIARSEILALWTMGSWILLPVVLLSPPAIAVTQEAASRVVALSIALPVVAVLAAPFIAFAINRTDHPNNGAYYHPLAQAAAKAWRVATNQPLRYVGGEWDLSTGVSFYLSPAQTYPEFSRQLTPWIDPSVVARDGIVLVCLADDRGCVERIKAYAVHRPRFSIDEVTLASRFLESVGKAERFVIIVVPPQNAFATAR